MCVKSIESNGCHFRHTQCPGFERRLLLLAKFKYIKRQSFDETFSGEPVMEKIGYALLLVAALGWLIGIFLEIPRTFPSGIIGLLAMVGIGLLFVKVLKERLANKEDDHYSKTVKK
jgi:hypothetical protein